MRGTVAKRIRKSVVAANPPGTIKYHFVATGRADGSVARRPYTVRQQYQDAKKHYMKGGDQFQFQNTQERSNRWMKK